MFEPCTPPPLDVPAFTDGAGVRSGSDLLSNHARLMQETGGQGGDRPVHWTVRGERRTDAVGSTQSWIHLALVASLPLTCQRCLGLADIAVTVDRWFRFVDSEALAEALDDEAEEDLLVTSRQFDLATLVEDELLLALPLVPRHDRCPVEPAMAVSDADFEVSRNDRPHPFAALARLRGMDQG